MADTLINQSLIGDARLYRLALRLESDRLCLMMYRKGEPSSMIFRTVALDAPGLPLTGRLEEAIYDNPLLLADFERVAIIIDSTRYAVLPAKVVADDSLLAEAIATRLLPADTAEEHEEMIFVPLPSVAATVATAVPVKLLTFLQRTFNNPAIMPPVVPFTRYLTDISHGRHSGKLHVNLRTGSLDIVAFNGDRLELANTFTFRESSDAVYYILSAKALLPHDDDRELLICGDNGLREAVTPVLRRYAGYVMPAIYPSQLARAPKDIIAAPFDLTLLSICE